MQNVPTRIGITESFDLVGCLADSTKEKHFFKILVINYVSFWLLILRIKFDLGVGITLIVYSNTYNYVNERSSQKL